MKRSIRIMFSLFLFASAISLASCGNGSSTPSLPPPQALVISSNAPPVGTTNVAYPGFAFTVASGGHAPFNWSLAGALPVGLAFSSAGLLSGTPTSAGSLSIMVSVEDSSSPKKIASRGFTIEIDNPQQTGMTISSGAPPNGTVGVSYGGVHSITKNQKVLSFTGWPLTAFGGTPDYRWHWSPAQGSSLPPGLSVKVVTAVSGGMLGCCVTADVPVIGGVPTVAGTYHVTVTVTDAGSTAAQANASYTITIGPSTAAAASALAHQTTPAPHTLYKLFDLGTLGGPNSTVSDTLIPINRAGTIVGAADTPVPDPFDPNCVVPEECLVLHTFQWRKGVLTDLGALTNGASSLPNSVNASGVVVGISENGLLDPHSVFPPEFDAVMWKNGEIIDLGSLGGSFSLASDVNDKDQVVGFALNTLADSFFMDECGGGPMPTQMRAFIWQDGNAMQDLGTLGGPDSCALWINQHGQVAGHSFVNSTPNSVTGIPTVHPFLWTKFGGMVDLGSLGGTVTHTSGLNNRGQVAGDSNLEGDLTQNAFLWDGEHMKNVTPGATYSFAEGLNENGQVVGGAFYESDPPGFAFLWSDGVLTNLVRCAGGRSINSSGQIVGFVLGGGAECTDPGAFAFLWENGGPAIDLNTLVRPSSDLKLLDAQYISDYGEITGTAVLPNGDQHVYLLIPQGPDNLDVAASAAGSTVSDQLNVAPVMPSANDASRVTPTLEKLAALRTRFSHRHHDLTFKSPTAAK